MNKLEQVLREGVANECINTILNEMRQVDSECIEFDNAEEALKFVNLYKNFGDELAINQDMLFFGEGETYIWSDIAGEFIDQTNTDPDVLRERATKSFVGIDDDATLLTFLKWVEEKQNSLFIIYDDLESLNIGETWK
ncbi:MAG: hypothetical protein LUD72_02680 [Bacteroidales bacterium]|nr:hypothetical protein [Bacteroidales bacterium]